MIEARNRFGSQGRAVGFRSTPLDSNPCHALANLAAQRRLGALVSSSQWELLAQLFHRAYLDPGRQFLQGRYIASSLRALNACRALMQRSGGQASFDSHCVEKHIYVPWWTAAQELAGTHSDERQALSRLEQIAEGVPPVIESFAQEITARCLLVAIADCVRFGVTPEALHGALQPYFADLLVVATRGAFRQTGEPVISADLQVYDPARCCV